MSIHGDVSFDWADGTYTFRLALGQVRELQEKVGCGPLELLTRIRDGKWFVDDLRETIRLGLIGGGMEPVKALGLVRKYFDDRSKLEAVEPAMTVLTAFLIGEPDDPLGKAQAAEAGAERRESSPSSQSTASAAQ